MVSTSRMALHTVEQLIVSHVNSGVLQNRNVLMGLATAEVTAKLAFNPHPAEAFALRPVSLHIVIPCIGRRSIFRLLSSLEGQLQPQVSMRPAVMCKASVHFIRERSLLCDPRTKVTSVPKLLPCLHAGLCHSSL